MFMDKVFGGWTAQLSNGATVIETEPIPGERTPWQQLLQKCRDEGIKITGLRLQFGPATIMAISQKECDGYYQARETHRINLLTSQSEIHRQGIGSVVGDKVYITWVEFRDGQMIVRSDVRPLEGSRIHTTLD